MNRTERQRRTSKITAHITGLGYFTTTPDLVDRAIAEYLPTSATRLQSIVEERTGDMYANLTVAESLVMLASFYAENPF